MWLTLQCVTKRVSRNKQNKCFLFVKYKCRLNDLKLKISNILCCKKKKNLPRTFNGVLIGNCSAWLRIKQLTIQSNLY